LLSRFSIEIDDIILSLSGQFIAIVQHYFFGIIFIKLNLGSQDNVSTLRLFHHSQDSNLMLRKPSAN